MAYIDPGVGTLVLQMIVAAVVGGLAFFRRSITALLRFGRRGPPRNDVSD